MAFVASAGQIAKVTPLAQWSSSIPAQVRLSDSHYQTYEQIWRSQPALRTVVGFLARNLAQLGLGVFERVSDTDRRRANDHPLARLMERPFPGTKWTRYRLFSWTVHERCIYDSAYWIKGRVGREMAIMPIPAPYIAPVGTNPLAPDAYEITGPGGKKRIDPDQVVHFYGYNPADTRTGVPPIETLRQVLAEEYAASQYREQLWRNGARVQGYIKRPKDAPRWSDVARARFRRDWNNLYAGDGPEAGGTPVLEDGMEHVASGITPRDAQYVEARRLTREEVAVAYYVPPMMLGLMDGAGQTVIEETHRILYQDTFGPWLTDLGQDIEAQLLPDLDPVGAANGRIYVEFNLNEKLRGSFERQAAALQASVGGPWMTRAEARAMFNLPDLPTADELIVPMNVTAGGLASPRDTAPNNPSNAESNGQPPGPKPVTSGGNP